MKQYLTHILPAAGLHCALTTLSTAHECTPQIKGSAQASGHSADVLTLQLSTWLARPADAWQSPLHFPLRNLSITEPQHPGPPAHHLEKHVDPQLCNSPLQVGRNPCLLVVGHRNTLLKDRGETALTCWPHPLLPWPGHSSVLSSSDSKRTQKLIQEPL